MVDLKTKIEEAYKKLIETGATDENEVKKIWENAGEEPVEEPVAEDKSGEILAGAAKEEKPKEEKEEGMEEKNEENVEEPVGGLLIVVGGEPDQTAEHFKHLNKGNIYEDGGYKPTERDLKHNRGKHIIY